MKVKGDVINVGSRRKTGGRKVGKTKEFRINASLYLPATVNKYDVVGKLQETYRGLKVDRVEEKNEVTILRLVVYETGGTESAVEKGFKGELVEYDVSYEIFEC